MSAGACICIAWRKTNSQVWHFPPEFIPSSSICPIHTDRDHHPMNYLSLKCLCRFFFSTVQQSTSWDNIARLLSLMHNIWKGALLNHPVLRPGSPFPKTQKSNSFVWYTCWLPFYPCSLVSQTFTVAFVKNLEYLSRLSMIGVVFRGNKRKSKQSKV